MKLNVFFGLVKRFWLDMADSIDEPEFDDHGFASEELEALAHNESRYWETADYNELALEKGRVAEKRRLKAKHKRNAPACIQDWHFMDDERSSTQWKKVAAASRADGMVGAHGDLWGEPGHKRTRGGRKNPRPVYYRRKEGVSRDARRYVEDSDYI